MAEIAEFKDLLDIPLPVEATLPGPVLRMSELLELAVGCLIASERPAGDTVDLLAGEAYVGRGELDEGRGRTVVRMVALGSGD